MATSQGIRLKKKFGQHFLRDQQVVDHMIEAVELDFASSVFEIGCGDGFLTRSILQTPIARLWVFEIDPEWSTLVEQKYGQNRLRMIQDNFLDVDLEMLAGHAPWTVLANLPYQITFPILHRFHAYRRYLKEGVVMVQEEVAQKLTKTKGRGYGFPTLFFQWYFDLKLYDKIPPGAFHPPPKVFSRLVYFKPKLQVPEIPDEQKFWAFIKCCFSQPRRMLRNNLKHAQYDTSNLSDELLNMRAQQLSMNEFLSLWDVVRHSQ